METMLQNPRVLVALDEYNKVKKSACETLKAAIKANRKPVSEGVLQEFKELAKNIYYKIFEIKNDFIFNDLEVLLETRLREKADVLNDIERLVNFFNANYNSSLLGLFNFFFKNIEKEIDGLLTDDERRDWIKIRNSIKSPIEHIEENIEVETIAEIYWIIYSFQEQNERSYITEISTEIEYSGICNLLNDFKNALVNISIIESESLKQALLDYIEEEMYFIMEE